MTQPLPTITVKRNELAYGDDSGPFGITEYGETLIADLPDGNWALLGPLPDGWEARPVNCEECGGDGQLHGRARLPEDAMTGECYGCSGVGVIGAVVWKPCLNCAGAGIQYAMMPPVPDVPCDAGCVGGMTPAAESLTMRQALCQLAPSETRIVVFLVGGEQ